jgi:hypothetical protein
VHASPATHVTPASRDPPAPRRPRAARHTHVASMVQASRVRSAAQRSGGPDLFLPWAPIASPIRGSAPVATAPSTTPAAWRAGTRDCPAAPRVGNSRGWEGAEPGAILRRWLRGASPAAAPPRRKRG